MPLTRPTATGNVIIDQNALTQSIWDHLGPPQVVPVVPVCDTSILADNDVIFDTIVATGCSRLEGMACTLETLQIIDKDDQGTALDLVFLNALISVGTVNSGPSISDANAILGIIGRVSIAAADFYDMGGFKVAQLKNIGLILKPTALIKDLYVAGIVRSGTPTYTASGLHITMGFK